MTPRTTASSDSPTTAPSSPARAVGAVVVDLFLVVAFAAAGQRQHVSGGGVGHLLGVATPFALALLVMSVVTRGDRTWARVWPQGVVVWLGTVALGMALRVWWGLGEAPTSFVLVAATVLGVLLLGRRALSRGVSAAGRSDRRRRRPAGPGPAA